MKVGKLIEALNAYPRDSLVAVYSGEDWGYKDISGIQLRTAVLNVIPDSAWASQHYEPQQLQTLRRFSAREIDQAAASRPPGPTRGALAPR